MKRFGSPSFALLVCLLTLGLASPALAQISAAGPPATIPWPSTYPPGNNTRGTSSAQDPVSGNFLVVGANGPRGVHGVIVNADGLAQGAAFQISDPGGFVNYVRTAYGAAVNGTGGFLVGWTSEDGVQIHVHTRMVSPTGTLLGVENVVSDAANQGFLEGGPAMAYSQTSQKFLLAWQGGPPGFNNPLPVLGLKARFVGVDGVGQGTIVTLKNGWQRDPGMAWNPQRDEFGISFSGENQAAGTCDSAFAVVPAGNLSQFRRTTFDGTGATPGTTPCLTVLTTMTDVAFSPLTDRYVMTWYDLSKFSGNKIRYAVFDEDAAAPLDTNIFETTFGSYDSMATAFNPISQTILVVGLNNQTDDIAGREMNGLGQAIGTRDTFAGAERGWLARVSSSQTQARWLPTYQDVAGPNNNISDPSMVPVKTATVTVPPVDTDGDGVYDGLDACPSVPGIAPTGCPDSDGDNVADNIDACPSTPGIAPSGCPDTDGDGKTDNVDACPAVFGTMANGCPDSDGDTVADNLDPCPTTVGLASTGCPASAPLPVADLNGDAGADLVFQNASGQLYGWFMNSWMVLSTGFVNQTTRSADWTLVGTRDFTGDGKSDLVWYNTTTGVVNLWHMDPVNGKLGEQTFGAVGLSWKPVATGDINGDGFADLLWQNTAAGQAFVWFMKPASGQAGYAGVGGAFFGDSLRDDATGNVVSIGASSVRIVGTGDVNLDGKTDILLQDDTSGLVGALLMNRQRVIALNPLNPPSVATDWKIRAVADFNGDSRPDLIWRNETTGHLYIWYLNGLTLGVNGYLNAGNPVSLAWRLVGVR